MCVWGVLQLLPRALIATKSQKWFENNLAHFECSVSNPSGFQPWSVIDRMFKNIPFTFSNIYF